MSGNPHLQPASQPRRLAILVTGVQPSGGIQRFNRLLLRAASAYVGPAGGDLTVLSLQDPPSSVAPGSGIAISGCESRRAAFAVRAMRILAGRYDAVLTDHVDLAPIVWLGQLRQPRRPWLVVTHGVDVWRTLPLHERLAIRRATIVAAVSDYTRKEVIARSKVDPRRTLLLPNALDPRFDAAFALDRPRDGHRIVLISRLDALDGGDKGIDTTIEALPAVLAQVPTATLTIVGEGNDLPRLAALATRLGVMEAVTFTGRISDEQLSELLASAAVFALPSRAEGFGIVYLEAMAHGVPVIGGAHGGVPEVVIEGETGELVSHGDVPRLASALTRFLTDASYRQRLGIAGRERVRTHYTYRAFEQNVFAMLDQLIDAQVRDSG